MERRLKNMKYADDECIGLRLILEPILDCKFFFASLNFRICYSSKCLLSTSYPVNCPLSLARFDHYFTTLNDARDLVIGCIRHVTLRILICS